MKFTNKTRGVKTFSVLVAVLFMCSGVCVDSYAQADASSVSTGSSVGTRVEHPAKHPLPESGNITVNFKDVDIKTVLHYLSEVSGVDIVPSPGVEANVTMRLRDKPWEVALDIVTRNYGYVYSREGDIIRVIPKGNLHTEEPITEVIPLNYIIQDTEGVDQNISQLLSAINSVIVAKAGERATFLPSANAIVVTSIPSRISIIKDMVGKVDKKTPQIMLEAKVIEVTLDRNDQFGVDWNAVVTAAGARRPMTFPFTNRGDLSFLPGDQRQFMPTSTAGQDVADFTYVDIAGTLADPTAAQTAASIFSYGTLDFSQFQAVLRMIDERDDTNILSSPRITTLNNQSAVIKVINNVYLQKAVKTSDTSATVTVEFEDEPRETGVILEVTPHVNDKKEITVNLRPQVSTIPIFEELSVSGAQNTVAMTYNSREADTQVMVGDGETIFIGGLIRETVTKEDHKLPILGDLLGGIPVLGSAFKYEQDNVDKTEVVFFVTVHLLKDGLHSIKASQSEEQYNKYFADSDKNSQKKQAPAVRVGRMTQKKEQVEIPVAPTEAVEEKKPFLDFRKK